MYMYLLILLVCIHAFLINQYLPYYLHMCSSFSLSIHDFRFVQSFNRPNLKYFVLQKKPKGIIQDVVDLITSRYGNHCGIVYCLSR